MLPSAGDGDDGAPGAAAAAMATVAVADDVAPYASVTTSVVVKVPAELYVCEAVADDDVEPLVPSPQFQEYEVIVAV